MNFNEYQKEAHKTADYNTSLTVGVAVTDGESLDFKRVPVYPLMKITAEASEILDKVCKIVLRGDKPGYLLQSDLLKEVGDDLWYAAERCTVLDVPLEFVAQVNIAKLHDRLMRGAIHGSGDDR